MNSSPFTKSHPKIQDYNPITHTSFYHKRSANNPSPLPTYLQSQYFKQSQGSPSLVTPEKNFLPVEMISRKNIFAQSGSHISRSLSNDITYFSKTRPRDRVVDTISGEVKVYDIRRPKIESLDSQHYRDKPSQDVDYNSLSSYQLKKSLLKPSASVSGSLKKEVLGVAYVDPYILKSTMKINYK